MKRCGREKTKKKKKIAHISTRAQPCRCVHSLKFLPPLLLVEALVVCAAATPSARHSQERRRGTARLERRDMYARSSSAPPTHHSGSRLQTARFALALAATSFASLLARGARRPYAAIDRCKNHSKTACTTHFSRSRALSRLTSLAAPNVRPFSSLSSMQRARRQHARTRTHTTITQSRPPPPPTNGCVRLLATPTQQHHAQHWRRRPLSACRSTPPRQTATTHTTIGACLRQTQTPTRQTDGRSQSSFASRRVRMFSIASRRHT